MILNSFHQVNVIPFPCPVQILRHGKWHCISLIGLPRNLLNIPVRPQVTQVHYPDIRPDPFHLLHIPEGKGIIVTIGEQDCIELA